MHADHYVTAMIKSFIHIMVQNMKHYEVLYCKLFFYLMAVIGQTLKNNTFTSNKDDKLQNENKRMQV